MQFDKDADVVTLEGEKLGEVSAVIIDPRTQAVSHLVIQKGFLFPDDKVLPVDMIKDATPETITLKAPVDDWQTLPDLIEVRYVPIDASVQDEEDDSSYPQMLWYPPVGSAHIHSNYFTGYFYPQFKLATEKNVPDNSVTLSGQTPVYTEDGNKVGKVGNIFVEPDDNQVTHFIIEQGGLANNEKLIPAFWVDQIDKDKVHLSVSSDVIENLPDVS